MGTINTRAFHLTDNDGPEVRSAATKMRLLHKRAGKVLKKLDQIIGKIYLQKWQRLAIKCVH